MQIRKARTKTGHLGPANIVACACFFISGFVGQVYFEKAVQIDPEQPAAHFGMANALYMLGRYDDAVKSAEKVLAWAESSGQMDMVEIISNRLRLYKAGKPYRERE